MRRPSLLPIGTAARAGTTSILRSPAARYRDLRKRYWGQHLWARGYWVATSGNVTDEVWMKYIEDQKPNEPDDHFKVV